MGAVHHLIEQLGSQQALRAAENKMPSVAPSRQPFSTWLMKKPALASSTPDGAKLLCLTNGICSTRFENGLPA